MVHESLLKKISVGNSKTTKCHDRDYLCGCQENSDSLGASKNSDPVMLVNFYNFMAFHSTE